MKRLFLLRHAQAVAKDAAPDRDRVLAPAGRDQMGRIAHHLTEYLTQNHIPLDQALVSPAARTRETWARTKLDAVPVSFDDRIYEATPETLIEVIQEVDDAAAGVILVGHNPGIQDVARQMIGFGDRFAAVRRMEAFPTGSFAALDIAVDGWREVKFGTARLVAFATPESLGAPGDD